MNNLPELKIGVIGSSRGNFSEQLSLGSRGAVAELCRGQGLPVFECPTLVETERDAMRALGEAKDAGCQALAVILGNFGPETPETLLAKHFRGPVMYAAAAEDGADRMYDARRDSYCGMLNCSYNLDIRNARAYLPRYPVGTNEQLAGMIARFLPLARAAVALSSLKLIVFGPRPNDFLACNAPLKPLFDLGVEVQENSELDLLAAFRRHEGDPRVAGVVREMVEELGAETYPDTLPKMAQYELTLLDWAEQNRGASRYVAFANKCWPAFQGEFGFLPCFVHSRLAARGIPVGCETDLYGALSEYIGLCVSGSPTAILDINNSVPPDVYERAVKGRYPYRPDELFVGFHCGNTCSALLSGHRLTYKMNRKDPHAPETGGELTRGTLEGRMVAGRACCFRLHGTAGGRLQAYIADGEILPVDLPTYGCYALFGVPEMDRFYRYVLLENHYPHHSAVVYGECAAVLYDLMRYLGVPDVAYNHPAGDRYPAENPFG